MLLTVKEVALELKTNVNTVYELINHNLLIGLKLGRLKVPDYEVERFIRENMGQDVMEKMVQR
ncbi:MAG: helix-turn-helix domain-containing protein [Vallitaleaceae bacterium]|jgi:excisionase family DNA binding protein|nr:helix-turn-helix domain-containing protein [Vallitaleaceae bacterium]